MRPGRGLLRHEEVGTGAGMLAARFPRVRPSDLRRGRRPGHPGGRSLPGCSSRAVRAGLQSPSSQARPAEAGPDHGWWPGLETLPGDTWQDRWAASGAEDAEDWRTVPAWWLKGGNPVIDDHGPQVVRRTSAPGMIVLICADVIRPGLGVAARGSRQPAPGRRDGPYPRSSAAFAELAARASARIDGRTAAVADGAPPDHRDHGRQGRHGRRHHRRRLPGRLLEVACPGRGIFQADTTRRAAARSSTRCCMPRGAFPGDDALKRAMRVSLRPAGSRRASS